jgi:signal transduction histidine kinase
VIRAATALALEQERTPEQYRETLRQVHDVSGDMGSLTGRLMGLAQANRPAERRSVNLADVTLMVSELHATDAQKRHIHLQVSVSDAPTTGDFDALVLAAGNLLQNAIKYSFSGLPIHLSCEADAEYARLKVQDAGPGIPASDVPRLTQPFQRGSQTQGSSGAGLGLALASAIADAHGGRLELNAAPRGGLSAELVLPRHLGEIR